MALFAFAPASSASECKLLRVAEWPVQLRGGLPIVEGAINGKPIGVLVDTGAFVSLVTRAAAERLGLNIRPTSDYMLGTGGESRVYLAIIDELRVAASSRKNMRVRVSGERPIPGVDFILGNDFFRELDVEFDYEKRVVRLFRPQDCRNVSLAYWDRNAHQVPIEDGAEHVVVPIKVNGRDARALFDSGASRSIVALSFTTRLGITPKSPGVVSSGCSAGLGADLVRSWAAPFDSIEIGNQVTRDPRMHVSDDLWEHVYYRNTRPEVVLGTDFLLAHRVLVSRSQRRFYFSYVGGQVFRATPHLDCDEELARKPPAEAMAALDAAIARDPRDVQARIRRGILLLDAKEGGEAKKALADLDAALAVEPGNPVALAWRASVRSFLKDREGAIADSDAAIARGFRTTSLFAIRAETWRDKGDFARAAAELGEALQIDPRSRAHRRSRARLLFYSGAFEAAESDFATLLAAGGNGFDTIWLALARSRRGLDATTALEQGIAKEKDGAWPTPVMRYLMGRLEPEALLAAAAAGDEAKRKGQVCEARYYIAARLLGSGDAARARPLIESAAADCPRDFLEYEAAQVELARLK